MSPLAKPNIPVAIPMALLGESSAGPILRSANHHVNSQYTTTIRTM
jgi:hypothetical protein